MKTNFKNFKSGFCLAERKHLFHISSLLLQIQYTVLVNASSKSQPHPHSENVTACSVGTLLQQSYVSSQSYLQLMLELMQSEEKKKRYWVYFCDLKGWTSGTLQCTLPSPVVSTSWSSIFQSHVLHPDRLKAPWLFSAQTVHTHKQLRKIWKQTTCQIFLWLCVCVCVCVFYAFPKVWMAARAAQATAGYLSAGLNVTCDRDIF